MSVPSSKPRGRLWLIAGCAAAGVAVLVWLNQRPPPRPSLPLAEHPFPPFSATSHLNTGPDVGYVGIGACAECHRKNHDSFLLTAHSRALTDLDTRAQPPDGSYQHQASARSYRIRRQDNQLRHEERLQTPEGREIAHLDLPIRHQIGSGHFARSYLTETDGFLHESPITWYVSKKKWDMSPGYDVPIHGSFERPVGVICLSCHVGRVEQATESTRVKIHEKVIGCESCHGPGAKHVEYWRGRKDVPPEEDLTIVNPGKLPRDRLEAVCAACHLSGIESIPLRGRQFNDFRPGRPLTDYRISYRFDTGSEEMTVAGHMEQLRRSACYQKSGDLTCVTCHDPHAKERPKDTIAFHRQKCLDCHSTRGCRVEPAQRLLKQPKDDCTACHMPKGDTEVPHVAFTHHRIGKHTKDTPPPLTRIPELLPIGDVSHLPRVDREHNLAQAYISAANNQQYLSYKEAFRERARELLEPHYAAGLRDGVTAQTLAKIHFGRDSAKAAMYAQQALDAADLPPNYRDIALSILIDRRLEERNVDAAVELVEELVRIRRQAEDWRLLGRLYLQQGFPQKALPALQQALAIRPFRANIHGDLASAYRLLGDSVRAADHQEKAQWLVQNRQD